MQTGSSLSVTLSPLTGLTGLTGSSLTGHWRLNQKLCTTQTDVLRIMGRKPWEISVIDKADEDFNLFHFKRQTRDGTDMHFFEKHVILSLDSRVLKLVSTLSRIEFDKVKYTHKLVANNVEVEHADDEKRFGKCKSRTTWEGDRNGFTIRWFIQNSVLKVFHFVNANNQLQVEMEVINAQKTAKCIKIYDRLPFSPEMQKLLDNHVYKQQLCV